MFINKTDDQQAHFNGNRTHSLICRHVNLNIYTVNPGVLLQRRATKLLLWERERETAGGRGKKRYYGVNMFSFLTAVVVF